MEDYFLRSFKLIEVVRLTRFNSPFDLETVSVVRHVINERSVVSHTAEEMTPITVLLVIIVQINLIRL